MGGNIENTQEWPDKAVNGMLADEPPGFHFHRVMFNPDTHEMEGLRPVETERLTATSGEVGDVEQVEG